MRGPVAVLISFGFAAARPWRRLSGARLAGVLLALALVATVHASSGTAAAQTEACATPFIVFTDPANPGTPVTRGPITTVRQSGLLGSYGGEGRFAGYAIDGSQTLIVNATTNSARVHGRFTATSRDGLASFFVRYTGDVDLTTGVATGHFVAGDGQGALAGLRATGTIEAQLIGPATFAGSDIGLC
jgi:hypothetical protein